MGFVIVIITDYWVTSDIFLRFFVVPSLRVCVCVNFVFDLLQKVSSYKITYVEEYQGQKAKSVQGIIIHSSNVIITNYIYKHWLK